MSLPGATDFVSAFYAALDSPQARSTLASFYAPPPTPTALVFNGNIVASGAQVQEIFVHQMPATRYEVQSCDCQIVNPHYPNPAAATAAANVMAEDGVPPPSAGAGAGAGGGRSGRQRPEMSMLVMVSGYVRYGDRNAPMHGFSETFVLVPNREPPPGRGARAQRWLIQSENFRLVT